MMTVPSLYKSTVHNTDTERENKGEIGGEDGTMGTDSDTNIRQILLLLMRARKYKTMSGVKLLLELCQWYKTEMTLVGLPTSGWIAVGKEWGEMQLK